MHTLQPAPSPTPLIPTVAQIFKEFGSRGPEVLLELLHVLSSVLHGGAQAHGAHGRAEVGRDLLLRLWLGPGEVVKL
jgi:hypothetical protein